MIERHNGCVGLKLFRLGKRQLELWFCPRHEIIESHSHKHIDSTLIFLWGRILGTIGNKTGIVSYRDTFRRFPIPAGVKHSAIVQSTFCLFLNWEKWKTGNVTSAAIDFESNTDPTEYERACAIASKAGMERRFYFYPQLGLRNDLWQAPDGRFLTDKQVIVEDFERTMAR